MNRMMIWILQVLVNIGVVLAVIAGVLAGFQASGAVGAVLYALVALIAAAIVFGTLSVLLEIRGELRELRIAITAVRSDAARDR